MSFFTIRDPVEGKVAIRKLPAHLSILLDEIATEYTNEIPDINRSTYHTWYDAMTPRIKAHVSKIQSDPYWANLCDGGGSCTIVGTTEMDELYYSNPKNIKRQNQYGASGNYDIHRDCFFQFQGINMYRILIGLTDGNDNIITQFTKLNAGHKLNKGDVIAFDFDNTTHQVIKERDVQTPRIMLKLHFLVCDEACSKAYIERVKRLYVAYELLTRNIMDTGTDPETWWQFLMGILCMYSNPPTTLLALTAAMAVISLLVMWQGFRIPLKWNYAGRLTGGTLLGIAVGAPLFFMVLATTYWARYKLTGVK